MDLDVPVMLTHCNSFCTVTQKYMRIQTIPHMMHLSLFMEYQPHSLHRYLCRTFNFYVFYWESSVPLYNHSSYVRDFSKYALGWFEDHSVIYGRI